MFERKNTGGTGGAVTGWTVCCQYSSLNNASTLLCARFKPAFYYEMVEQRRSPALKLGVISDRPMDSSAVKCRRGGGNAPGA